ncbi:Alkaline phosphatase PafA precursor [compost metagenome]
MFQIKYKYLLLPTLLLLSLSAFPQQVQSAKSKLPAPKLVIGIVVDQMRWDYLYRFYERYGKGGFRRMLSEGFTCENTLISHLPTYTAIGHSSIYTGSVPAIHGIAGNDFIDQRTGQTIYCTGDSTEQTVGSISSAGKMSPRNMLATTITDELKLSSNFRAKVIGLALKDRGGILPAGHTANAAYWMDDATGNWITSTFYMRELPAWVKKINEDKQIKKLLSQDWNTLYPINTYVQSNKDDSKYEGKFKGSIAPVFPVKLPELEKTAGLGLIRSTPFGNTLTLNMAREAIVHEQMGQNDVTDFLAISLSSTDYIGHQFGINSIEIEDTYLRLDQDLAIFLKFLDKKLGKDNYTVFLSADHGGAHNPLFLQDHKLPGDLWNSAACLKQINNLLNHKYGKQNLVLSLINNQVHLNNAIIRLHKLDAEAIKNDCILFFQTQEGIAWAVDMEKTHITSIPADIKERIINGYNRQRSGIIQLILQSGWYAGATKTGTTHGAWNPYDAHIPLVWMGWGIKHGKSDKQFYMTDIAPTIGALLNIQPPSGSIGKPIQEVLK